MRNGQYGKPSQSSYIYYEKNNDIQIISNQDNSVENANKEHLKNSDESVNNTTEENEKIVVYITGEVLNSAVYEMNPNDRIADVIEKAGGLKEEADIKNINLACILEDGMKIYIPNVNEKNEISANVTDKYQPNDTWSNYSTDNSAKSNNSKVNINVATQSQLEALPSIGPSTATKIIDYRNEHGKFKSIEDIKNVSGIGESKFTKIKNLITI